MSSSTFRFPIHHLPSNYFTVHNSTCDICKYANKADAEERATGILRTCVVAVIPCGHIYHGLCVFTWISGQVNVDRNGTCPMCRCVLVSGQETEEENVETAEVIEVIQPVPEWPVIPEGLGASQQIDRPALEREQRATLARLEAEYLVLRAGIKDTNGVELDRLEMDHRVQIVELRYQQHLEHVMLTEGYRVELTNQFEKRQAEL